VQCPARPQRYAEMSKAIMRSLVDITPDIEVFSVDEAFLDVTRCQRLFGVPEKIAHLTRQKVQAVSGLPCSIGVSGDKTTAKYAAELIKPNGLTIIPPWEARERLRNVPVTELCGIGDGIGLFLARHGVYTCGEMEKLPISILSKRFGNLGRRLWYMCQGADPEPVHTVVAAPKSMGHGKVLPPYTTDVEAIKTYLQHMSEKLAARLRRHQMKAKDFFIGLSAHDIGWLGGKVSLVLPSNDGRKIYELALQVLHDVWHGQALRQVQITALQPTWQWQQGDLFDNSGTAHDALLHVVDAINHRYGQLSMAPARLLKRSQMPDVIAPAWKPDGHRKTV
jgi:DNA polymerase-4